MKLVTSNSAQPNKLPTVRDRTFILSQEAYAIIQHRATIHNQSIPDTLNAFITVLDSLMLDGSLHSVSVTESDGVGLTYTTSITPIPEASSTKLKAI